MAGTPLIITDEVQERIAAVKAYAEAHRLDFAEMLKRAMHQRPFEDLEQRELNIPIGFRAVYSIEQHPPPADWCHHFSFTTSAPGRMVNEQAAVLLIKEFGVEFPGWDRCGVYIEEYTQKAINIIIPFVPVTHEQKA